jgi:hypothetical protein
MLVNSTIVLMNLSMIQNLQSCTVLVVTLPRMQTTIIIEDVISVLFMFLLFKKCKH